MNYKCGVVNCDLKIIGVKMKVNSYLITHNP